MSAGAKPTINYQDRDLQVLLGLFESRVMTLAHVTAMYFDGKKEAAKKRVQRLKSVGVVGQRPRRTADPSVLFLTRRGFELLRSQGMLTYYPDLTWGQMEGRARVSDLTLRHELAVMDVKAAFATAIAKNEHLSLVEFSTWPAFYEFYASPSPGAPEVLVKPDGFIRIRETDETGDIFEHTFFLEVDRSTETQATLVSRAACYVDFYRRGGLALRNGRTAGEYKEFPFRLLIVLQSTERRDNTAHRLLNWNPPIYSQAWLTTMQKVMACPLDPIWTRPADNHQCFINRNCRRRDNLANLEGAHHQPRPLFISNAIHSMLEAP